MARNGMEGDGLYVVGRPHVSSDHPRLHQDVFETFDGHTTRHHLEITPDAQGLGRFALGAADAAQTREQRGR